MPEQDAMRELIQQWKETHKADPRDFDFDMLCAILDMVNEGSAIKVARNPLDDGRNWITDTVAYNVGKVFVDDEGRLTLCIRKDKDELSADKLGDMLKRLKKKVAGKTSCVMAQVSESKTVQITDVYSHALVRDSWAGLPFDVVLAYYEADEKGEEN